MLFFLVRFFYEVGEYVNSVEVDDEVDFLKFYKNFLDRVSFFLVKCRIGLWNWY